MSSRLKTDVRGTFTRLFYILIGLVSAWFGLFVHTVQGHSLPPWRRVLIVLVGVFWVYCGSLYYFPSNRRKRAELNRLLDEAERELES
jgi:uncharacterized membrane protein YuzA (DUF378 family)